MDQSIKRQKSILTREEKRELKKQWNKKKKRILCITLLLNLGILALLKYINFFVQNINLLLKPFHPDFLIQPFDLFLPLGISFYTFMSVGYCIDIYRGEYEPEKNMGKYALFVAYFPHILSGPIDSYKDLAPQLYRVNKFNYNQIVFGLQLIVWGFFKKMVVADRAALYVDKVFTYYTYFSGFQIFLACILYAIQIYADFSGYIDIARGVSECFGIELAENFKSPYFSKSVSEFWRRWHITLGAWFRNYLFYPIMRSAWCNKFEKNIKKHLPKSIFLKIPTIIALCITWASTGLWHGAYWKYVAWGMYYGLLIILALLFKPYFEKLVTILRINTNCFSYKIFQTVRTFILVCIGYLFFRAESLQTALKMLKMMIFHFMPLKILDFNLIYSNINYAYMIFTILSSCVILAVSLLQRKIRIREQLRKQNLVFRWLVYFSATFLLAFYSQWNFGSSAKQFIYFKF